MSSGTQGMRWFAAKKKRKKSLARIARIAKV
jgi:hypothetical protein